MHLNSEALATIALRGEQLWHQEKIRTVIVITPRGIKMTAFLFNPSGPPNNTKQSLITWQRIHEAPNQLNYLNSVLDDLVSRIEQREETVRERENVDPATNQPETQNSE